MIPKLFGLFCSFGILYGTVAAAQPAPIATAPACGSVSEETCRLAQRLGRGINMGNMLEAPREGDFGLRLEPAYIDRVSGVFRTVRIPVRWSNHAAPTADAKLDEFFAARVDSVVDALLAKGVHVILNVQHYDQLTSAKVGPNEFAVEPEVVEQRLVGIWKQLGERYRDRSPRLVFELYNEPNGRLDGEPWNRLAAQALAAVRASNPTRTVMIGPTGYNAVRELPRLRLPADRNLIVSFHSYEPFNFTHQGVSWVAARFPAGVRCCDAAQKKLITDTLDAAQTFGRSSGYPLHMGEFGSYLAADMDSREAYTRFVRDEAEKRGIGWTYWAFASSFGMYQPQTGQWVEPIRRALLD